MIESGLPPCWSLHSTKTELAGAGVWEESSQCLHGTPTSYWPQLDRRSCRSRRLFRSWDFHICAFKSWSLPNFSATNLVPVWGRQFGVKAVLGWTFRNAFQWIRKDWSKAFRHWKGYLLLSSETLVRVAPIFLLMLFCNLVKNLRVSLGGWSSFLAARSK